MWKLIKTLVNSRCLATCFLFLSLFPQKNGSCLCAGIGRRFCVEAAETKGLVPVALRIAEAHLDPGNRVESWTINLLRRSLLIDTLLQHSGDEFRLSGQTGTAFEEAIVNYSLLSAELRMHFQGKQWWNYTIKQHALSHIGIDAKELSPRPHGVTSKTMNEGDHCPGFQGVSLPIWLGPHRTRMFVWLGSLLEFGNT